MSACIFLGLQGFLKPTVTLETLAWKAWSGLGRAMAGEASYIIGFEGTRRIF